MLLTSLTQPAARVAAHRILEGGMVKVQWRPLPAFSWILQAFQKQG